MVRTYKAFLPVYITLVGIFTIMDEINKIDDKSDFYI